MSWQGIEGHDETAEHFRKALARGRLASTFLFVGPRGIGKRTFALKLAQTLLCQPQNRQPQNRQTTGDDFTACGVCPCCIQVTAGTHPDLEIVGKPKDRSFIPVATFIGKADKRMQEGLCHDISLKPFMGGRKIAIILDADYLNEESANALLKTLEEPPPNSVLILIGTSANRQLPTIRSRCQTVRFAPLPAPVVARLLVARELIPDPSQAEYLAANCEGSLARAIEMADPDLLEFRRVLLKRLSDPQWDSPRLATAVATQVDSAGKDASLRRDRLRQIIGIGLDLYRQLARHLSGAAVAGDDLVRQAVADTARWWAADDQLAVDLLDRCLEALGHVDRNANQSALIHCWIDDLAQGCFPARISRI